jgi:hypothetical protein
VVIVATKGRVGGVRGGAIFKDSKIVGLLYSFMFQIPCYNLKEGE